jgi:hypothetical protein
VKRTFSGARKFLAGLSRQDTLKADGKKLGQFRDSMVGIAHDGGA